MFHLEESLQALDKQDLYAELSKQTKSLLEGERDLIANMANVASLLFHTLPTINWAGFYLWKHGELVLGPFQGKPACVRIALGRGVCGTAVERRETLVVPDVHLFPGHIACDAASRSEIVVPLIAPSSGELIGVLDIDSPAEARFDDDDREALERIAALLLDGSDLD
jgi:GAF domain-containing protein